MPLSRGHSGHHAEEVSQLAILNLLLSESIHHVPLARDFVCVWRYCHFCGLGSKVYRILQRITKIKNRIDYRNLLYIEKSLYIYSDSEQICMIMHEYYDNGLASYVNMHAAVIANN